MALANINERQAEVARLIQLNGVLTPPIKADLANRFSCSASSIFQDIARITNQKSRASSTGQAIKKAVHDRDGGVCQYCGNEAPAGRRVLDHIYPAFFGGKSRPHNLVTACCSCNSKKGRSVWIPRNFDQITIGLPKWRRIVKRLAKKDFRVPCATPDCK